MATPSLIIVKGSSESRIPASFVQKLEDHHKVLTGYLDTHLLRNHSKLTIEKTRHFLSGWFEGLMVQDPLHPDGERQLMVWEAMTPVVGRQRIMEFGKGLIEIDLKPRTIITYLGYLRRFFAYVIEYPYIPGTPPIPIAQKYGPIEQPVLEYDYPVHTHDPEHEGFPPTGNRLLQFYEIVRTEYVNAQRKKHTAERDYTMVLLAGETGLRANELSHLDLFGSHRDIFYKEQRIQTRFGKGSKGSGPRPRKTIFTPLAQATLRQYELHVRPHFPCSKENPALFLNERGRRMRYRSMWTQLNRIVNFARAKGVELPPDDGWHMLRRSFATGMLEKCPGKIWELMNMLGHSSPSSLHRYIKHTHDYVDRSIDQMIEYLINGENQSQGES